MAQVKSQPRLVMIGAGHLGALILKAWIKNKSFAQNKIHVHLRSKKSLLDLKKKFPRISLSCEEDGGKIPAGETYVIAVKPQQWPELKTKLQTRLTKKTLLISIMAGIPPSRLENESGAPAIVAMTNTSIQVGEALTSLYKSPTCPVQKLEWAQKLFSPFGMVAVLDEKEFATATAFGGSHPAFAVWIMNEIAKIISTGLPGQNGMDWTLQVFSGAQKLIRKKGNVEEILKQIATPGGCTAEGLRALQEHEVAGKLESVFDKCIRKAETLGNVG